MLPDLSERAPLLVMAVGNILRGDDGFADAVLNRLAQEELPAHVELFDAGTSAIDLMEVFNGRDKLIVVDAIRGGQAPGTLYRFSPEEVEDQALPMNSLHQVGLLETLKLGELVDCKPKQTVVVGAQPGETGLGIGLSPEVEQAVERAVELIKQEINNAKPQRDRKDAGFQGSFAS
ncbi:MAG: hydrogenase maturation protease [Desulfuromonadales bacterium]|nr:hydrogenase maturation protease [Desulfuromonadales bacterium]NIR33652.1 hydrogenase maturation protease [Desulfuromonadales bacterium]NIS43663.1 hydrogenase maturation protease [Desulfuromonadales bacterium]